MAFESLQRLKYWWAAPWLREDPCLSQAQSRCFGTSPAIDEDDVAVADLLDGVLGDGTGRQHDLLSDVAVDAVL